MSVESNDAIAIATLSDWRKKSRASISTNGEKLNQLHLARAIIPALWANQLGNCWQLSIALFAPVVISQITLVFFFFDCHFKTMLKTRGRDLRVLFT